MSKTEIKSESHLDDSICYTYILECSDHTLYTGWTNDLPKRIKTHNTGKGARYTRGRLPVTLVYCEKFTTKQDAMKREIAIKKLSRQQKLQLIAKHSSCKPLLNNL